MCSSSEHNCLSGTICGKNNFFVYDENVNATDFGPEKVLFRALGSDSSSTSGLYHIDFKGNSQVNEDR